MLHSIQRLDGIRALAAKEKVGTIEEAYLDDGQWGPHCGASRRG